MVQQYTVCDDKLPYPGLFPYLGLFPYIGLFTFPGVLQVFIQYLILGLPISIYFLFVVYFHIKVYLLISVYFLFLVEIRVLTCSQFLAIHNLVNFRNIKNAFGNLKIMSVTTHHQNSSRWCNLRGERWSPAHANFGVGTQFEPFWPFCTRI